MEEAFLTSDTKDLPHSKQALIIDDEEDFCVLLTSYLEKKGFRVHSSHRLEEGMRVLGELKPHLVFLDHHLPDGLGWDALPVLRNHIPQSRFFLISAHQTNFTYETGKVENDQEKLVKVFEKPISFRELDRYI
jgi:two-component system OmpR family response regulator